MKITSINNIHNTYKKSDIKNITFRQKEVIQDKVEINTSNDGKFSKKEAIEKMNAIAAKNSKVVVKVLPSRYPQGGEKVLIFNTTMEYDGKSPSFSIIMR